MWNAGTMIGAPTSDAQLIEDAATRLDIAARTGRACAPVHDLILEGDVAGAYAVQDINTRRWMDEGRRLVGRKIGLTAASVQKALGIGLPDFGMLFADMDVPDGEEVSLSTVLQPRVEGELAFVLGADLKQQNPTIVDVVRAIAFVLPAIEIVDSRIENWELQLVDTIADNASSGRYVLGTTPARLDAIDLQLCGMTLLRNGEPASTGAGLACLGNPLNAVRWLASAMAEVGRPLMAGDVVLSGALGPMLPIEAGDRIEVAISGLGPVSVRFEA